MPNNFTDAERKEKVAKAREILKESPSLSIAKVGPMVNISGSYLSKLLRRYPRLSDNQNCGNKVPEELMGAMVEEFKHHGHKEEEPVKGYLFIKNADLPLNILSFETKIPAGLKGVHRKRAMFSAVQEDLGIEEI